MAEDFLEEIYKKADVLQKLHDAVKYSRLLMLEKALEEWNGLTGELAGLAKETALTDAEAAARLMNAASLSSSRWGDPAAFSAEIERGVIPAYLECLKYKACIDVEDGRYRIVSADSAYLTVYDSEQGIWLHDDHDPMAAASDLAEKLYRPGVDEFHIFGCGLGYEAYQIYMKYEKSVRLYIYEIDKRISTMAFSYGVLDRIDGEMLEIVSGDDPLRLKSLFMDNSHKKNAGCYTSFWEAAEYSKLDGGELVRERMLKDGERSFERLWEINAYKNLKRANLSFESLKNRIKADEWIAVAAGPSLDDNMEFLKINVGRIKIVAVETVLKKLLKNGITPDVVTVADPKEAITRYITGIEDRTADIPLIAGTLSGWKYLDMYRGDVCLIAEGENVLRYTEGVSREDIWNVGGTVASLALEAAVRLGAKKIHVVGLDLAYPGGRFYASGSDNDNAGTEDGEEWVKSNNGGKVRTSPTFRFFIEQIEQQVARYPMVDFINLSADGALIRGMKR